MGGLTSYHDIRQAQEYAERGRIPSKEQLHAGLFASHFFDINPELDPIDDLVTVKLFSSKFQHPIKGTDEQIVVLGVTGCHDGQNRRPKTDIILVVDRSGSMCYRVNDIMFPAARRHGGTQQESTNADGRADEERVERQRTKMELTIEAAESIFDFMEDDEEVGVIMFDTLVDTLVDTIEDLKSKGLINREKLFQSLDSIQPRGGTDIGLALSAAISMFQQSKSSARNKRIIFLTDASPTVGDSEHSIRDMAEQAFGASNGFLGVTYCGIGLSFDAAACDELSRVHSTTIFNVNTSVELHETLDRDFNYLISPVAFDVRIGISSSDYSISRVYGGDSDCQRNDCLLEFRTLTASSVGAEGIKGSILIIHLTPKHSEVISHSQIRTTVDYTPFGSTVAQHQEHEYFLNEESMLLTEKAFALSVYFETLQEILPASDMRQEFFTLDQRMILLQLQTFLKSQSKEVTSRLAAELHMVDQLIADHCEDTDRLIATVVNPASNDGA
jgi:Ca-activated chloride channel family protein